MNATAAHRPPHTSSVSVRLIEHTLSIHVDRSVVVMFSRFTFGDVAIAVGLLLVLPGPGHGGFGSGEGLHPERRRQSLQALTSTGRARGQIGSPHECLELVAARQAFELIEWHASVFVLSGAPAPHT